MSRRRDPLGRPKAWLVTGPLGRGFAFAIDFAVAVRNAGLVKRASRSDSSRAERAEAR